MRYPNYAALGEALKIYTDAMRELVSQRLRARYGDAWWQSGVLDALNEVAAQKLDAEVGKHPREEAIDRIDPFHLIWIIIRSFDEAFRDLGNLQPVRTQLHHVSEARNTWAHAPRGDLKLDDVAHALYAMEQVLGAARLPEATAIEGIRNELTPRALPNRVNRTIRATTQQLGENDQAAATHVSRELIGPPSITRSSLGGQGTTGSIAVFSSTELWGWGVLLKELDTSGDMKAYYVGILIKTLFRGKIVCLTLFPLLQPGRYHVSILDDNSDGELVEESINVVPSEIIEVDWRLRIHR